MRRLIRQIKALLSAANRISEINDLDKKLADSVAFHCNEFEKKIQALSFAYTADLNDVKSDYLKRYVEVRLNNLGEQFKDLPSRVISMQHTIEFLYQEYMKQADEDDDDLE